MADPLDPLMRAMLAGGRGSPAPRPGNLLSTGIPAPPSVNRPDDWAAQQYLERRGTGMMNVPNRTPIPGIDPTPPSRRVIHMGRRPSFWDKNIEPYFKQFQDWAISPEQITRYADPVYGGTFAAKDANIFPSGMGVGSLVNQMVKPDPGFRYRMQGMMEPDLQPSPTYYPQSMPMMADVDRPTRWLTP